MMNSSIFSSAKKQKEEKKEFVFEETSEGPKGSTTPRSVSRSRDPVRPVSLTPKGLRSHEKKPSTVGQQTPRQQKTPERSQISTPKKQQKEFFPESSRKLEAMNSSSATEAKFK